MTTPSRADLPPVKVYLNAGDKTEVTSEERAAALADLVRKLEAAGLDVDLRIAEHEPAIQGTSDAEQIALFIGQGAASVLIGAVVTDAYNRAKEWARERFRGKGRHARPERVVLQFEGVVRIFEIDSDGETETMG